MYRKSTVQCERLFSSAGYIFNKMHKMWSILQSKEKYTFKS